MSAGKVYDLEYKIQAVKLANEIGQAKAATELGIPRNTVYTWICRQPYVLIHWIMP